MIIPGIPFGPEIVLILLVVVPLLIVVYIGYRIVLWFKHAVEA